MKTVIWECKGCNWECQFDQHGVDDPIEPTHCIIRAEMITKWERMDEYEEE